MSILDARKNFAVTQTLIGYDESALSIQVSVGDGARFPQPSTDGPFNLVWWNYEQYPSPADDPKHEIVRCTARNGDVMTIVRGQEGTVASTKNIVGQTYLLQLGPTSKTIDDIEKSLDLLSVQTPWKIGYNLYMEYTLDGNGNVVELDYWDTPAKGKKLFTKTITYTGDNPTLIVITDLISLDVLTTTLSWTGSTLNSVTKVIT